MVMTLYCSLRYINSFAASFASWSAISFPVILALLVLQVMVFSLKMQFSYVFYNLEKI